MVIHDALIARLRRLSIVPRWTIVPTVNKQNTAEHSFHVAWIALWLGRFHVDDYTATFERDILLNSILHDAAESVSGDIPSTFKRTLKPHYDFKALDDGFMPDASDSIRQIVKMADYIEALLFLSDELNMGNGRINDVYSDVLKNAEEVWEQFEWYSEIGAEKPKIAQILNKLNQAIDGANAV